MDDQNKNLILATALSFLVILVWFVMFPPPEEQPITTAERTVTDASGEPVMPPAANDTATAPPSASQAEQPAPSAPTVARIAVETPTLSGSIALTGGIIDDLSLTAYKETLEPGSENVSLFRPRGEPDAYYTSYGWAPGGDLGWDDVPGASTVWTVVGAQTLTPQTPVTLEWANAKGMTFQRTISIDEDLMFTVNQSVANASDATVRLAPFAAIYRQGEPQDLTGFFVIHEGAMRQTSEERSDLDYKDFRKFSADDGWGANADVVQVTNNGWLGFTDHYWMSMLIPASDQPFTSVLKYDQRDDTYQTHARLPVVTVAAGQSYDVDTRLFAGAKEWATIRHYQDDLGVYRFIDSIDWGWFFFLTKPIFSVLHWINGIIGNMGWSIIGLTLMIKLLVFPLAYKSYVSMAKMKELQPEMEQLKERAGDDRQKLQQEMMALYKKEKVNPASGCLPILLQIPIFFSLYKVIFVTIELRHAPWVGWIKDLSAPDPSSILNLFGLLPYATPGPESIFAILSLGILPIILGISMWLQQKLNPAPTDPTQAMIFAWMPWVFMFMLGSFASGLVVYWIANNVITFTQQYLIMRSVGYKPDILGNIRSSFQKKPKPEE